MGEKLSSSGNLGVRSPRASGCQVAGSLEAMRGQDPGQSNPSDKLLRSPELWGRGLPKGERAVEFGMSCFGEEG